MDNELLLDHPTETKILSCNETASLVWQLCDGQHTRQEIVALLAEAYPDASERVGEDVESILEHLARHGVIEFV